jgi:hypothetical protein
VLRYSLRALGLALLSRSSSSAELSMCVMLLALFVDDMQHLLWSLYLASNAMAASPTSRYTGKRLTMDQYEEEGSECTKKALEELRLHLTNHPDEANHYMDKFR